MLHCIHSGTMDKFNLGDSSTKSSLESTHFLFFFLLLHKTHLSLAGWPSFWQATVWFPLLWAPSNQHKITEKASQHLMRLTSIFGLPLYQENRHIKNISWLQVNQNGKLKWKNICLHIKAVLHAQVYTKTQTQSRYGQSYPDRDTVQE